MGFYKSGPKAYFLNCRSGYYVEVVRKESRPSGTGEAGATYEVNVEEKTERYWQTLETFPMHLVRVPYRAEAEFLGALSYGASERVLEWSKTSFPFSDQQAQRLLQVYFDLKNGAKQDQEIIPHLYQAQIYRQVAVAPSSWSMRLTDIFLACVLFGVQKMYRVRLEGERVGGVIYTPDMRELFQHFLAEWSDTNLLATVFVGGNIGFLAVPGINGLQRTASLASSLFAIMSIITGLHHVWQHRSGVDASAEEVRGYLYRFHTLGKENDLAALACFLSLPPVALIWSLLSFSIALGAFCIQGTGLHGRRLLAAMLILLGVLSIATILFFWHIWRGPHREEISDENVDEVIADGWAHSIRRVRTDLKKVFRRPKRGNAAHELTTRSEA
ncbi:hypothetical protein A0H81_09799 [Grifola frondosa]|uniref:Uncharacterized protein n=1 Tax=Grifola frondosa TaxID=5627 RepID=A0A1C7M063_GRIFR|nr:hypothetical protein A0H81_09799 [Grifola frondosa]